MWEAGKMLATETKAREKPAAETKAAKLQPPTSEISKGRDYSMRKPKVKALSDYIWQKYGPADSAIFDLRGDKDSFPAADFRKGVGNRAPRNSGQVRLHLLDADRPHRHADQALEAASAG